MPGYRLRPVAGKDRNPARGRFRQGAGQPGEPLQRDWLGSRHGPAYAVAGRGRTELDAAPCPDREEPAMRASAGQPVRGAARAGLYPLSRFWGTAGPAEVAGGCSRRPERRGWHASRRGKAAHAGRPVAALAAGTGHRRPVGAGHRGLGGAWSGVGVLVTCWCHRAAGAVASGPVGSAPSGRAAAGGIPAGTIPAGGVPRVQPAR